jgi:Pyruvate/2-oxoacid:ferredoxin oxidoreductase delta subunit
MADPIYEQLAEKIFLKGSTIIPLLFAMIADRQEAELMLAMPGTTEELAVKIDLPAGKTAEMCGTLYLKGLAFKSFKGESVSYKMCRDIVQFHDASILWRDAPKEYHDLWQKYMEEEWPAFARAVEKLLPRPFARVVPVHQAVEAVKQQVLDIDSARKIVESAEKLAVTRCTCRVIAHKCDNPVEVCLQVNNAARYTIDRGSGREVTVREALGILDESEKHGLVHVTNNKAHAGHFICNCCSCCCQSMPLLISEGLTITDPSRYRAKIDPDACTLCGNCLEACIFKAIEEGDGGTGGAMRVIGERCMGCGLCFSSCPSGAVALVEVRPVDFIPS